MNQAIEYVEKNFETFDDIDFAKTLKLNNINNAKRTFINAIKEIANRNLRRKTNADLVRWARAIKTSNYATYFVSNETKLFFYKTTRQLILTSNKLISAEEELDFYNNVVFFDKEGEKTDNNNEERSDSPFMVTSSNNAFDNKKFEENFMRMKKQHKWYLSTGKCVEDELFAFGLQCLELHPAHSFIMDPTDTNYTKYNVFSCDELVEIRTYHEKSFPSMPVPLRNYINSFNKNSFKDLRQQLFTPQNFDKDYDHKTSHDYDWVRITIYQLLREYEAGTLKKHHSEEWYMAHIWNFIDTIFNDMDVINDLRGETASCSSSKRKNQNRSIGAIEPLERKKIGSKCDMIFARESCGHDQVIEYGASEAGKNYDGDGATKRLEEGFLKLPKCLKDMLDNILSKVDDFTKLQTLGFIHSGLQSYLVCADRPTKYITRITKSRTYHISNDITEFGKSVLPAIYIAWVIKDIVAKMDTIIAKNISSNNNEDESSEWLEQYWTESDKENVPETSSSQEEKSPKKSKTF